MESDREAGGQRKGKQDEESMCSVAADLETDRRMRTEEGDSGGPPMRTRARKRNKEKDSLSHDSLPSDLDIERKMKEEEEDESPAKKSRMCMGKEEEGEEEPSQMEKFAKEREEEDGGPSLKSGGSNGREEDQAEKPAQDGLSSSRESGWKQDRRDVVSQCPDLVQDKIFELLSLRDKRRVAQVCSSWQDAVYRPCHWKGLTVKVRRPKQVIHSLKERQICGVRLDAPCRDLKKFLVELKTLQYLDLSFRNSEILLESLLESISDVRFESVRTLAVGIGNKTQMNHLKKCLTCFPNLWHLDVSGVITTCLLEAIVDQLNGLECLSLRLDRNLGQRLNLAALGGLKRLQHLHLNGFPLEGVEILGQVSSTLKTLSLFSCNIPGGEWTPILSQLRSLNELQLLTCLPVVDSAGLRHLAQALPNLNSISYGSEFLKRLAIAEEDWMNDDHLSAVAEMSGLKAVYLCYDSVISDTGVLALCSKLRNLRVLCLALCNGITSKSIEHISNLSSLTELSLGNGRDGGEWLKILAQGSCKLRKLHLIGLAISDEGMQHLAQMSTLCNLRLRKVSMGPAGTAHLSEATFHLESLEIIYCGVTVKGLTPLLQRQTSLRRLTLVEKKEHHRVQFPF